MTASTMIMSRAAQRLATSKMAINTINIVRTATAVRNHSTNGKFAAKEKVEEDRYVRELEKEFYEKKKAEQTAEMALKDQEVFQKQIAPVMVEVQQLLKKTNDSVSSHGLEAIARWKLNL